LSRLQALLLVEARVTGKLSVPPVRAEHTINDTPREVRQRLLSDLVRFTRAPLARRRPSEITLSILAAAVRSCRYAQAAGDSAQAAELIGAISGAAKRLGYYARCGICATGTSCTRDPVSVDLLPLRALSAHSRRGTSAITTLEVLPD